MFGLAGISFDKNGKEVEKVPKKPLCKRWKLQEDKEGEIKLTAESDARKEQKRINTILCKRRKSLMTKAKELNKLTGTEVLLVIASKSGNTYHYASNGFKSVVDNHILDQVCRDIVGKRSSHIIKETDELEEAES